MLFLALSIFSSTCNHLIFKAFEGWNVSVLPAIVANYFVCVLIGYHAATQFPKEFWQAPWFYFAILQGILLIVNFYLIALTTQKNGIAIASLASRLAVVLPTITAFFLYSDLLHLSKVLGIFGALVALYLSSLPILSLSIPKLHGNQQWPLLLFFTFGFHLTLAKYVQAFYLENIPYHHYIMFSFISAFLIGLVFFLFQILKKNAIFQKRDLFGGILLGVANYGSVYFLLKTLAQPGWESSKVFPTISIGVVSFSFLGGFFIFKENVSLPKRMALIVGILSILAIHWQ